ncbi:MAG: DUF1993 family protein [Lysobacterales bacterium]
MQLGRMGTSKERVVDPAPPLQEDTAGGNERKMKGNDYLQQFALPNFYFFVTTAYDILRHRGVPIGKRDFLGPVNWL